MTLRDASLNAPSACCRERGHEGRSCPIWKGRLRLRRKRRPSASEKPRSLSESRPPTAPIRSAVWCVQPVLLLMGIVLSNEAFGRAIGWTRVSCVAGTLAAKT